jgi:FKBP-type peptidyl-prolyl cis-trans isomerase
MQKLKTGEWVAVAVGVTFTAFMIFGGQLMNILNMTNNKPTTQESPFPKSGVNTQDTVEGHGAEAGLGDIVTVHYVGVLPDGRVFDSSLDRNAPFSFTLGAGEVIRGWDEGLVGMKVGGRRQLFIASDYGYGPSGNGPIPPNSNLVFEVELLDVQDK